MIITKTVAVVVAAALSGCAAPGEWVHHDLLMNKQQDQLECEYEARKATAPILNPFYAGAQNYEISSMCMQTRGYTWRQGQ